MNSLNDSGVGSASRLNGVTPLTSKKRPLVNVSGKTPSAVSKKRKIQKDRSDWYNFHMDVPCDDFLTRDNIRSESIMIEGSEWYLAVRRVVKEIENANSVDGTPTDKNLQMEVTLQCAVPSAAWCAKCKIEFEVQTESNLVKKAFNDCNISSSSFHRGITLDWRKHFLRGGQVSAYLRFSRVCNKYLNFPDFSDPYETGIDELIVENHTLYVDKSLLSLHSKFFAKMFSSSDGPYILANAKVADVIATLRTVYPEKGVIDESNACTIAVLAKEFEFWEVLQRCEQHLLSSNKFSMLEKIEISLKCQMHTLLSQCSEGLNSMEDVLRVVGTPHPDGMKPNEKTKAYLFDLILTFNNKIKDEEVTLA